MTEKEKWAKKILPYIDDLPRAKELAKEIADFICENDPYYLSQIAGIIDEFYGEGFFEGHDLGGSIAWDIDCLWRNS